MKVYGSKELMEDVIGPGLCVGCGACINLCPYFGSYKGKTANFFACTLPEGRCFAYCPKVEVDLEELSLKTFGQPYDGGPLGHYRLIKASHAGPGVKAGGFQAGGTISALVSFGLKTGYFKAAVLTDKERILPVPRLVTDPDEVFQCSGSKYTAAPTLAALNQAVSEGYSSIGLVGTPCQVMAAAQMRTNPMKQEPFNDPIALVLGLFCTWSLDFRLFEPYISEVVDINEVVKVDIPPPPAEIMEIYTRDSKIEVPLEEIRPIVSDSCAYCPDMTSEFSDISVGVLENRPDRNTLIIRTDRGLKFVEEAEKAGYVVLENLPAESLDHLSWAAGNKKKRAMLKAGEEGRLNTAADGRRSLFRLAEETRIRITG